jgi:hypothetical protein
MRRVVRNGTKGGDPRKISLALAREIPPRIGHAQHIRRLIADGHILLGERRRAFVPGPLQHSQPRDPVLAREALDDREFHGDGFIIRGVSQPRLEGPFLG